MTDPTMPRGFVPDADPYIQTLGGPFFFFDPARHPETLAIEHVAKALSHVNRFTGQTFEPYSVAQHSVAVASVVWGRTKDKIKALQGLLHDSGEAFLGDVSSPLKAILGETYKGRERAAMKAILDLHGVPYELAPEVKEADLILLATEKRDLTPGDPVPWGILEGVEPIPFNIEPWPAALAARRFLETFENLTVEGRCPPRKS